MLLELQLSLSLMQKLIVAGVVDGCSGEHVVETLWMLMEAGVEELKVLQTVTLLLTTSPAIQGHSLAKVIVPTTHSCPQLLLSEIYMCMLEYSDDFILVCTILHHYDTLAGSGAVFPAPLHQGCNSSQHSECNGATAGECGV